MGIPVRVLHSATERKPKHGEPCNQCGVCCMAMLCSLAEHVMGPGRGPCPALECDGDDAFRCGMVANPARYAPHHVAAQDHATMSAAASIIIGEGYGCDCRINGEPKNMAFEDRLTQWDRDNAVRIKIARIMWGMSP